MCKLNSDLNIFHFCLSVQLCQFHFCKLIFKVEVSQKRLRIQIKCYVNFLLHFGSDK